MTMNERLQDALDNLRAADRFRRKAETMLDERMMNAAQRDSFLTPEDATEVLDNLRHYIASANAAVTALT